MASPKGGVTLGTDSFDRVDDPLFPGPLYTPGLSPHPSQRWKQIIEQRMNRTSPEVFKDDSQAIDSSAVGLIHGNIMEVLAAVDIADKAAQVSIFELMGTCQQHFTTIAILGDVASVDVALKAGELYSKSKK